MCTNFHHHFLPLQAALSGVLSDKDFWPWDNRIEAISAIKMVPSGVLLNFPLSHLLQLDPDAVLVHNSHYGDPYSNLNSKQIRQLRDCKGTHLFVGARRSTEPDIFTIAAIGSVKLVSQETRGNDTKHEKGVFWYFCKQLQSFGFSGEAEVKLTNGSGDVLERNGETRLSWIVDTSGGGGRAGVNMRMRNDGAFQRAIYCFTPRW